jgi:hypothetical protein
VSVLPEQLARQDPLMMQTFTQRPRKIGNSPNILDLKKVVTPKDQQIPQHFRCIEYALGTALDGAVQEVPWQKEGQDLTFLTHFFILSAILSALDSSKIASAISKN